MGCHRGGGGARRGGLHYHQPAVARHAQ